MRRAPLLAALILASAPPAPARAAAARVEIIVSAPAAAPSAAFIGAAAALSAPSLAPAAAPGAFSPYLSAPIFPAAAPAAPQAAAPRNAPVPAAPARPALALVRGAGGRADAAAESEAAPDDAGRLFDGAPAAPDFAALSPVRAPEAPAPWTPRAVLLKPVAAAVNAWRTARHEERLAHPALGERVTTEEEGLRDSLSGLHAAVSVGRFQDAITIIADFFQTRAAASWYAENPGYAPYRARAFDYMRFAERAVLKAYGRAHARAGDPVLIAEARAAAGAGRILGHAWRPTAIQEKDSSFCAQNALFNAIAASVGFARPTTIFNFVAASRAALNREARLNRPADPREIAALAGALGVNLGRRDVAEGMSADALKEWASILGMKLAARGPPSDEAGWSALFAPGRENLLSLRMFHPKFAHDPDERALRGHDYRVIRHEVYLLGAFDSPSRGARLFLAQDSGSGATLMATAEELTALVEETQTVTPAGPVSLPQGR